MEELGVHQPPLAVHLLENIIADPDSFPGLQLLDCSFLQVCEWDVDELNRHPTNNAILAWHEVNPLVVVIGCIGNDHVVVEISIKVLVIEIEGRQVQYLVELLVVITEFQVKLNRWFTEGIGSDLVNIGHHPLPGLGKFILAIPVADHPPQLQRVLAHQVVHHFGHITGVLGIVGVWHHVFRNNPVLFNN